MNITLHVHLNIIVNKLAPLYFMQLFLVVVVVGDLISAVFKIYIRKHEKKSLCFWTKGYPPALFYPFPFTLFFFFSYPFCFNFAVSDWNVHFFFADLQYLGVTFFPLLDVSEQNYFSGGGGGHMHPLCMCLVKYFCFSNGKHQQWENLKKLFWGFIKDFKDCSSWILGFSRKI